MAKKDEGLIYNFTKEFDKKREEERKNRTEEDEAFRKSLLEAFGIVHDPEDEDDEDIDQMSQEEINSRFAEYQGFINNFTEYIQEHLPKDRLYYVDPKRYKECLESAKMISSMLYGLNQGKSKAARDGYFSVDVKWSDGAFNEIYDALDLSIKFDEIDMNENIFKSIASALPKDTEIAIYSLDAGMTEGYDDYLVKVLIRYHNVRHLIASN